MNTKDLDVFVLQLLLSFCKCEVMFTKLSPMLRKIKEISVKKDQAGNAKVFDNKWNTGMCS